MSNENTLPLIKPSDARSWILCKRRVWLDNKGEFDEEPVKDPFDQLIVELGLAHEETVLQALSGHTQVHTATSAQDTVRLMAEGVPIIYQGRLVDEADGIGGNPDFLLRHKSGEYQPSDAKLSRDGEKKEILIQLGVYRRMLGSSLPAIVFLGNGERAEIGDESDDVATQFVDEMRQLLASNEEPRVRYSHSRCRACPYYQHCKPGFEAVEELSLLYGVDGRAAAGLEKVLTRNNVPYCRLSRT